MKKIDINDIKEIYNLNNEILQCYNFKLINFFKNFDGIYLKKNFEIQFDFEYRNEVFTIQNILSFEDKEKNTIVFNKIISYIESLQQDNFFLI